MGPRPAAQVVVRARTHGQERRGRRRCSRWGPPKRPPSLVEPPPGLRRWVLPQKGSAPARGTRAAAPASRARHRCRGTALRERPGVRRPREEARRDPPSHAARRHARSALRRALPAAGRPRETAGLRTPRPEKARRRAVAFELQGCTPPLESRGASPEPVARGPGTIGRGRADREPPEGSIWRPLVPSRSCLHVIASWMPAERMTSSLSSAEARLAVTVRSARS
jgi:hypothetical protein